MTTRASALYLGRCHKKANQGPLRIPRPSRPCLLQHIFRTITGATLLRRRNTPNQKVSSPSVCRSAPAPPAGARVFCLAAVPGPVLAAFPWSAHGEPGALHTVALSFQVPQPHSPHTAWEPQTPPPAPPSVSPAQGGAERGLGGAGGGGASRHNRDCELGLLLSVELLRGGKIKRKNKTMPPAPGTARRPAPMAPLALLPPGPAEVWTQGTGRFQGHGAGGRGWVLGPTEQEHGSSALSCASCSTAGANASAEDLERLVKSLLSSRPALSRGSCLHG